MARRYSGHLVSLLVRAPGIPAEGVSRMKRRERRVKYLVRLLLAVIFGAVFAMYARGEAVPPAATLSLSEAIGRAIQTQLTIQLARAANEESRGRAIQAAASLLPQITGTVAQSRVFKNNLAAAGFEASPLLPNPVIGPYNTF